MAWRELRPLLLRGGDTTVWNAARNLLNAAGDDWSPPSSRAIRLGVLCTYESAELTEHLAIACAVLGIDTLMHAAKAIEAVLVDMKTGQFAHRNAGMDFEDYKKLVGFDDWVRIDEQFAPPQ